MPARIVSAVSSLVAIVLLLLGVLLVFGPDESAALLFGRTDLPALVFSLLGAALFGLGMMTWMTRHAPIGGIYGRPVLMASLAHFVVGGLALLRAGLDEAGTRWLWALCVLYLAGAAFYGLLLFSTPKAEARAISG